MSDEFPCAAGSLSRMDEDYPPYGRCTRCRHVGCVPLAPCPLCVAMERVAALENSNAELRDALWAKMSAAETLSVGSWVHYNPGPTAYCAPALVASVPHTGNLLGLYIFGMERSKPTITALHAVDRGAAANVPLTWHHPHPMYGDDLDDDPPPPTPPTARLEPYGPIWPDPLPDPDAAFPVRFRLPPGSVSWAPGDGDS